MKMSFYLVATLFAFLAACGDANESPKQIGEACENSAQCADGQCLDLHAAEDACEVGTKVCTKACDAKADCPTSVAAEPDCEPVAATSICIYGGWLRDLCDAG